MRCRIVRSLGVLGVLWLGVASTLPAMGEIVATEWSGRLSLESRWFPETGLHPDQRSQASGFVLEPTFYLEDDVGRSVTLTPFFRYDGTDDRRTHADLREAYLLLFGAFESSDWEVRIGVDRVFWGVTESQHLVDIINQIDFVEHPNGEVKLGQPMVHVTWAGELGTLEVFGLPYHRARTAPGVSGRLRFSGLIDEEVVYESGAEEWHPDVAARYSHSVGPLDFGLSVFEGTSREAGVCRVVIPGLPELDGCMTTSQKLELGGSPRPGITPSIVPYYPHIRQVGLDAQLTLDAWLLKLEAIHRTGEDNTLFQDEAYLAAVMGGEYTFSAVGGSVTDLVVLAEWNYDERGRRAVPRRSPMTLDNDYFVGAQLLFNDIQSTELSAGFLWDASRRTQSLGVELDRRLSDRWSGHVESNTILSIDPADLQYSGRRDSFIEFHLEYHF